MCGVDSKDEKLLALGYKPKSPSESFPMDSDVNNVCPERKILLLGPADGKVSIATKENIHQEDVPFHEENFQTVHLKLSPNIKTCPIYIDFGKSPQRIASRSSRIPDIIKKLKWKGAL